MITATAKVKPIGDKPAEATAGFNVYLQMRNPRLWRVTSGTLAGELIDEGELEFLTEPKEDGRYPCSSCGRMYVLKHAISHCDEHPGQIGTDE